MTCTVLLGLSAATLILVGCSTAPATLTTDGTAHALCASPVALGQLGPSTPDRAGQGTFYLGAGDPLGQEIFAVYVASIRSEEHYATGESGFLEDH